MIIKSLLLRGKRILLIIFLAGIFAGQTLPILPSSEVKNLDKLLHFLIYFLLTFLFYWNGFSLKKSVIFSIGYGALMEVFQIPLPLRDFSLFDFLANCGGAFGFWGLFFLKPR